MKLKNEEQQALERLCRVLDASHSAFHATHALKQLLDEAGYTDYTKQELTKLPAGSKGYFLKNDSALLAFHIGSQAMTSGFRMIGAHTDSPTLRIKPNALMVKEGALVLNTEVYGGPTLNTWFDRPLSLAGRVVIREEGRLVSRLVDLKKPILLLPNLAIHMNRKVNDGVAIERQKMLLPVLSLLSSTEGKADERIIYQLVAAELGVKEHDVVDYDLYVYDIQPAALVGLHQEFINSPRLDNVAMSVAAVSALLSAPMSPAISLVWAADNEEVGSRSMQGAFSLYLRDQMERIYYAAGGSKEGFLASLEKSFVISADQAHAVHPHYPEVADPTNRPKINEGPVIKLAANLSYATDAYSAALFRDFCAEAGVPVQNFVNHSDRPGGSTIGPLTTTFLHCPTVDIGNALWGMHSVRETGGVLDQYYIEEALRVFLSRKDLTVAEK